MPGAGGSVAAGSNEDGLGLEPPINDRLRDTGTGGPLCGHGASRDHERRRVTVPGVTAAELDAATMRSLAPYLAPQVGILLGAGASIAAGLPSWELLAQRLLTRTGVAPSQESARRLLDSQDPLLVAEAARARSGDWEGDLRAALYGSDPEPDPAALHLAVAGLAAARAAGDVSLNTLNFDPLLGNALRDALAELGSTATVVERWTDAAGPRGAYTVNHLHGLLGTGTGSATGVLLTLSDFLDVAAQPHPWQVTTLAEGLSRGPLIIAGTSYRDPDIRQWLHDLRSPHPKVVLVARQGLGLDRESYAAVIPALQKQWDALGVTPIFLHDHADAAQALRELPHLADAAYQSPTQRAAQLIGALAANFDTMQAQHSRQLASDLDRLRPHLGDEANLTLWLVDGGGQLLRWSAPDRVYRTFNDLRVVVPGYDSPWLSGRCLGQDDILVEDLTADSRGATQRWKSVVAAPIPVDIPGGPAFSAAVLSSATVLTLDDVAAGDWETLLGELASEWAPRLTGTIVTR